MGKFKKLKMKKFITNILGEKTRHKCSPCSEIDWKFSDVCHSPVATVRCGRERGWCSNRTFVKQNISDQTFPQNPEVLKIQKIPLVLVRAPTITNLKSMRMLYYAQSTIFTVFEINFFFQENLWIIFVPLVLAVFLLVRAGNQSFCPARRYTNRTFPPCIDILFLSRVHSGLMYILPCCIFMQD